MTARAAQYIRLGERVLAAHQAHAALCVERDRLHQQLTAEDFQAIRLYQQAERERRSEDPTKPNVEPPR